MHAYTVARLNEMGQPVAYYAGHDAIAILGVRYPEHGTEPTWTRDPDRAALTDFEEADRLAGDLTDYEFYKGYRRSYIVYRIEAPAGM